MSPSSRSARTTVPTVEQHGPAEWRDRPEVSGPQGVLQAGPAKCRDSCTGERARVQYQGVCQTFLWTRLGLSYCQGRSQALGVWMCQAKGIRNYLEQEPFLMGSKFSFLRSTGELEGETSHVSFRLFLDETECFKSDCSRRSLATIHSGMIPCLILISCFQLSK